MTELDDEGPPGPVLAAEISGNLHSVRGVDDVSVEVADHHRLGEIITQVSGVPAVEQPIQLAFCPAVDQTAAT